MARGAGCWRATTSAWRSTRRFLRPPTCGEQSQRGAGREEPGWERGVGRQARSFAALPACSGRAAGQNGALQPPHRLWPKPAAAAATTCAPDPCSRAEAGLKK